MQKTPDEVGIQPLLVSPKQAAGILGIGMTSLYQLLGSGALDSVKIGGHRRIKYASILRLAEHGSSGVSRGQSLGLRIAG